MDPATLTRILGSGARIFSLPVAGPGLLSFSLEEAADGSSARGGALGHGLFDFGEEDELGGRVGQGGHEHRRRQQGEPGFKAPGGRRCRGGGAGCFVGLDFWFHLAGDWGCGTVSHSSFPLND